MNTSCEGNRDRLCKTMQKIFHNKRHNKRPPHRNEHKPCGDKREPSGNTEQAYTVSKAVLILMLT